MPYLPRQHSAFYPDKIRVVLHELQSLQLPSVCKVWNLRRKTKGVHCGSATSTRHSHASHASHASTTTSSKASRTRHSPTNAAGIRPHGGMVMEDTHNDDHQQQTDSTTEGGEDLDTLAREAAALDGQPEQAAAAELQTLSAALASSNAAELLAALMMARGLALPILPKAKSEPLREVWTNEVLEQIAESGGLCLALSGQGVGDLLGKYAPYVALIGALVRPVLDTREIMARPLPKMIKPVHTGEANG